MRTDLNEERTLTLPGPAVTAPMTWTRIERELVRRGFVPSEPIAPMTDCVRWTPPSREYPNVRVGVYTRNDFNTWPEKEAERMTETLSRLADLDGVSPGEMLARLAAGEP